MFCVLWFGTALRCQSIPSSYPVMFPRDSAKSVDRHQGYIQGVIETCETSLGYVWEALEGRIFATPSSTKQMAVRTSWCESRRRSTTPREKATPWTVAHGLDRPSFPNWLRQQSENCWSSHFLIWHEHYVHKTNYRISATNWLTC